MITMQNNFFQWIYSIHIKNQSISNCNCISEYLSPIQLNYGTEKVIPKDWLWIRKLKIRFTWGEISSEVRYTFSLPMIYTVFPQSCCIKIPVLICSLFCHHWWNQRWQVIGVTLNIFIVSLKTPQSKSCFNKKDWWHEFNLMKQ